MLERYFGDNIHRYLYILGLCGLAFGIPINKVVMSVSMMFLGLNFFLEFRYLERWNTLKGLKLYWLLFAIFALHLLAITWSSNFEYAFHDLRVKLPLFIIPTIILSYPVLSRKELNLVLLSFLSSALIVSLLNFMLYQNWIGDQQYDDIRGLSYFGSHVRFGIIVSMAAGITLYFLKYTHRLRIIILLVFTWFFFYTYYSQVISGALTMLGIVTGYIVYLLWSRSKFFALTVLSGITIASIALITWLVKPVTLAPEVSDLNALPTHTSEGNPYIYYDKIISPETAIPVYYFYCETELKRDWPKYSSVGYFDLDKKGQPIRFTMLRYMTSKRLTKDANGLSKLTEEDVQNIEDGIGTDANWGVVSRLYGLKFSLINNESPNGNSLLERIEYWKAGWNIFKHHFIFGVGTGDVQDAFTNYYIESNSQLLEANRHRAHNMYLTVGITFGIFGLALFLFYHFKLLQVNIRNKEIIGVLFLFVVLLSFLIEDTLETQTGVTFCALFYGLFSQLRLDEGDE